MAVICTTAAEFGAALDAFMTDEVDAVVGAAAKAVTSSVYQHAIALKTTWSPLQPNDIFTGQFRYSFNIAVGSPNTASLPSLQQPWPMPDATYSIADAIASLEMVASIQPYDIVYVSNSADNAQVVEDHTGIIEAAADLAMADAQSTDFGSLLAAYSVPF